MPFYAPFLLLTLVNHRIACIGLFPLIQNGKTIRLIRTEEDISWDIVDKKRIDSKIAEGTH